MRYVRDYLNGSTVNTGNHWTEIEVWGTTTAYVGDYYEWNGSLQTMTRYYYADGQRVAVRNGNGSGTNGLVYLLGDQLGSASLTADPLDGDKLSELRYKAWGETRYALTSLPTDRRFTGQVEEAGLGLYFFNARWYDSALGRFAQADSIIPGAGEVQAWDRYAAMGNNPVKYVDPTGHAQVCADGDEGGGCGSSGNIPDKEKLEIIRKERKEYVDEPFDASLGGNNRETETSQQVLRQNGSYTDEGVNWGKAIVGIGLIIVGGVIFYTGVLATQAALSTLNFELAPLTALTAVAGGGFVGVGVYALINSGLIPGTKRK